MKKLWNWMNILTVLLVIAGVVAYYLENYPFLTVLLVIAGGLQVRQNWNWIKQNVLRAFVYISVIVAILMIILYFLNFHKGLSDEDSSWSNFGSYFASITGLMAFAGVMYTAWQSENRAKTAKDETIAAKEEAAKQLKVQKDRAIFFKMLDLYQKQLAAVTYSNKNGIEAFSLCANDANRKITMYIVYNEIINDENLSNNFYYTDYKLIMKKYNISENGGATYNENNIKFIIANDIKYKKIVVPKNFNNKKHPFFYSSLSGNILMNYKNKINFDFYNYAYNTMRRVADSIDKDFGYFLGQYYRNISCLLVMISKSSEDEKYSEIFKAQLSRYELILLLYNAVSSQSDRETVILLKKYKIFDHIIERDIFLNTNTGYEFDFKNFINNLFDEYLKYPANK